MLGFYFLFEEKSTKNVTYYANISHKSIEIRAFLVYTSVMKI